MSGAPVTKAARLVDPAEPIELLGPPPKYVSRGGLKLEAALEAFGISPDGLRCLDVGASTGGFTDCLLQGGARHVVALDVGTGQLDWTLRNDPRVTSLERTDIRKVDPEAVGAVDLVVVDVSFISLRTVLPEVVRVAPGSAVVCLVKPQFEVGRARVGSGGVVRDPALHLEAVETVSEAARGLGFEVAGSVPSPIEGADGNREFLLYLRQSG